MEYYAATKDAQEEINVLLDLPATGEEQDWEYQFADPERIDSMLRILADQQLSLETKSALCQLMIASFEVAFEEGIEDQARMDQAASLIRTDPIVLERMRFYWLGLGKAWHPKLTERLLSVE
jgi:hypothetical protein